MAGEKSILSGEAGQLITKNLLKLCGFHIAEHIQYPCLNKERHKSKNAKSGRGNHDIDGTLSYDSPLNHDEKKVILISAKHHINKYSEYKKSKLYGTIKDLAQSISCARESSEFNEELVEAKGLSFGMNLSKYKLDED